MKLLSAELKRLKYHLILWGLVLVSAVYGVVMAVQCRDLPGGAEFLRAVLSDPVMSIWMCSLLPVVLVGQEFASREVNWFLFSGYRRREYFGIKAAELVVFTGVLCGIPLLFMLFGKLGGVGAGELLRLLCLRLLLDCSLTAFGMLFAFLLRDLNRCAAVSLTYGILVQTLYKLQSGNAYQSTLGTAYRLLRLHPVSYYKEAMSGTLPPGKIAAVLIFIGLAAVISYAAFHRAELK